MRPRIVQAINWCHFVYLYNYWSLLFYDIDQGLSCLSEQHILVDYWEWNYIMQIGYFFPAEFTFYPLTLAGWEKSYTIALSSKRINKCSTRKWRLPSAGNYAVSNFCSLKIACYGIGTSAWSVFSKSKECNLLLLLEKLKDCQSSCFSFDLVINLAVPSG